MSSKDPVVKYFGSGPLRCHAWNSDRTLLAISHNSNEVVIYSKSGNKYTAKHTLSEHTSTVTGIDWAPKTNRIVTCGADRNAFVWSFDQSLNEWKPILVLLRVNRACTLCRWSPKEDKFAVGTGARLVSICYFEEEHNWWISKHIKKPIKSTITTLDWHPNNYLVATGCTDFKVRVFSAYIKEMETKPSPNEWGSRMPFGELMYEYDNPKNQTGWVHCVSFNHAGDKLAMVSHDSSVTIMAASGDKVDTVFTSLQHLPFHSIIWISDQSLLAAGYDFDLRLLNYNGKEVKELSSMQEASASKSNAGAGDNQHINAFKMFKQRDLTKADGVDDKAITTIHKNTIMELRIFAGDKSKATSVSSSGCDGRIVIWDTKRKL